MATVSQRPPGATEPPVQVDLTDPAARAEWLAGTCEQAADVIAAALDATKPPARRMLGRKAARELIHDAAGALSARFAAVGLDLAAPPSALHHRREQRPERREAAAAEPGAREDEGARDVAALGVAALDFARAQTDGERDDVLQLMPLAGVLFLALTGSRGERTEVDPPLLQALCALRDTADGWLDAPSNRMDRTSILLADLDLFVRRLEATIEIARRGGMGGAP